MVTRSPSRRSRQSRKNRSYRYELLTLAEHERNIIREAMERLSGNVADCAIALGIAKSTMYEKLYTYGLRKRSVGR